jgi:hypothetical protein
MRPPSHWYAFTQNKTGHSLPGATRFLLPAAARGGLLGLIGRTYCFAGATVGAWAGVVAVAGAWMAAGAAPG